MDLYVERFNMEIIYLGHQGWYFKSGRCSILVDPLFGETFGRGRKDQMLFQFWPPRIFDFSKLPSISAVFISHEHEDHFHIPTLNQISRRVPIYMSALSSKTSFEVLKKMGFKVFSLEPGRTVSLGPLKFRACFPDQLEMPALDEFDTLGYVVSETKSRGVFFTPVDVPTSRDMRDAIRFVRRDSAHLSFYAGHLRVNGLKRHPKSVKFYRHAYRPTPGQVFSLVGKTLKIEETTASFLCAPPFSESPTDYQWFYTAKNGKYLPACGKKSISKGGLRQLQRGLCEIAEFVFDRHLFHLCNSAERDYFKKPTVVFILKSGNDGKKVGYEYDPRSCCFKKIKNPSKPSDYMSAFECWASDLLEIFRGNFEVRILTLGHCRYWDDPLLLKGYLLYKILWPFFHPLRRPKQNLKRYLQQYKEVKTA
jgi:hypothetical protein